MKKILALLLAMMMAVSMAACGGTDVGIIGGADGPTDIIISDNNTAENDVSDAGGNNVIAGENHAGTSNGDDLPDNAPPEGLPDEELIAEDGWYYTAEEVSLYLATYGYLPGNFITKDEARALGWDGGSVERYAPGCAIGGDYFSNREGLLPKATGRDYYECDINTNGASSRGAERLVFSSDGNIYYTPDHYESFELLYEGAW